MDAAEVLARSRFDRDGLVAAVAQQHDTGEVLMLAWMNRDAVSETLATGRVCYWSRSRRALWRKGETSGHTQRLVELRVDCDGDARAAAGRSDRRRLPHRAAQLLLPRRARRRPRHHRRAGRAALALRLVREDDGDVGFHDDVPRRAAEDHLAQPALRVGALDQKVGARRLRLGKEDLAGRRAARGRRRGARWR